MNRALGLVAAITIAGCGGSGSAEHPEFPRARASKVQSGMTKPEVQAIVGEPHHMILIRSAKCIELWKYESAGEVWGEYYTLNVAFDSSGHVCDVKMEHVPGR